MLFKKSTYLKSLFWLLMSILSSCFNDVVTKYLANGLTFYQICFFRFLFGNIVLIPIMFHKGCDSFRTERLVLHLFRGLFLSISMALYAYSLTKLEMSTVTVIGLANPIFVVILSRFLLKESVNWPIWIATFFVFIGISLVLHTTNYTFSTLTCILSTVIFALLDIINKKYVSREPILSMIFFSNFMALFFMFPTAYYYWQKPSFYQLLLLGTLGVGSNLILYFLLKAFKLSYVVSLAPIRCIELVISTFLGYLFFQEWPTYSIYLGAGIIIPSIYFILNYRNHL